MSLYQKIYKDGRNRILKEIGNGTGSVMNGGNIKRSSLFRNVLSNLVRDLARNRIGLLERYTSLLKEDE